MIENIEEVFKKVEDIGDKINKIQDKNKLQ